MMSTKIYRISIKRPGKPVLHYIYAWRGGPCLHKSSGGARPEITPDIIIKAGAAWAGRRKNLPVATLNDLIRLFCASPDWQRLALSTKDIWGRWLRRIAERFGTAPIEAFSDRRMRSKILAWRDTFAHQPRSADIAMQALTRLLNWSVARGHMGSHALADIEDLYQGGNRADIVWTEADMAQLQPHCHTPLWQAIQLMRLTGLRREDGLKISWDAVFPRALIWRTGKSRGRATAQIPMTAALQALLTRLPRAPDLAARLSRQRGRPRISISASN